MENANKKISISVVISLLTLVASFLTSFIFTKFLLSQEQIGDINYGLKTTADSFVSFVSIFTFGMSATFIRFHKKYRNDEEAVFSSFNLITSIISLVAIVFGVVLFVLAINNKILDPNGGVYNQQQVHDFSIILVISISYIALSVVLGNSKWFLESTKNIVLVRLVNLAVVVLYPTISTPLVVMGANMVVVTLVYSVVYLGGFLTYLFFRIKKVKTLGFLKITKLRKDLIKEILVFSFFVVLTSSIETFNHSIDKLILTISFSASLTTIYQLSITLNQVLLSLADIIYAPYLPFIAEDVVNDDRKGIQLTYDKVNLLLLGVSYLVFTGFTACGKEFVYLWVGEGKEMVYYFSIVLFAVWPLYGMVKFSNAIQRLSSKHYKSTLLFVVSFVLHIAITCSLVWFIGLWACIIGTAVSTIFLGISFLFYNTKQLGISQKFYCKNLMTLAICSTISVGFTHLISFFLRQQDFSGSHLMLLLIEGALAVIFFAITAVFAYWKDVKRLFLRIFNDEYSNCFYQKPSYFTVLKGKMSCHREPINRAFPYVCIAYFLLNFASYYLGGLNYLSDIVGSPAFTYLSKILSYLVFLIYGFLFVVANDCEIHRRNIVIFSAMLILSILSGIVVPKHLSFIQENEYGWMVKTTFSLGLKDVIIGNLNWFIDLIIMFFYLYIFRQRISRRKLVPFLRFIVAFTIVECLYSFVFQYQDYLYFFSKSSGDSNFNGYSTNLSGTFASKNGFGFLLFQSVLASYWLIRYEYRINANLYWIPFALTNVVNVFSLCKTSAISALVFDVIIFISWLNRLRANNKKKAFSAAMWCLGLGCLLVVLCFTPLFRRITLIDKVVNKTYEIFFVSGDATIRSRILLWEYALKMVKGPYLVFGYGKTASALFLNASSNFITFTFHNGILDILCSFGIFGVLLYYYGIKYSYFESTRRASKGIEKTIIVAVIVAVLLYGMMENVYLLISSSSTMLVPNLMLSVSQGKNSKQKMLDENNYVEISI